MDFVFKERCGYLTRSLLYYIFFLLGGEVGDVGCTTTFRVVATKYGRIDIAMFVFEQGVHMSSSLVGWSNLW